MTISDATYAPPLWCSRCKTFKPETGFPLNRAETTARRGRHNTCRACQPAMRRESAARARLRAQLRAQKRQEAREHAEACSPYAMRRWWLDRYSLDEIRELAGYLNANEPDGRPSAKRPPARLTTRKEA